MSQARLLFVGSDLPYCKGAAPYGFGEGDTPPAVAAEGPGTVFPLIMSPARYAWCFWRVKTWKLTGDIEVDYAADGQTWQGNSSFELLYERKQTENELVCLTENNNNGSPFNLGNQSHNFFVTVTSGSPPSSSQVEWLVEFAFDVDVMVFQNELVFTAVGASQTSEGDVAASLGVTCFATAPEPPLFVAVSAETEGANPGKGPTTGSPIASLQVLFEDEETAPQERTVPLFLSGGAQGVSLSNLKLRPVEYYPYALNGRPALYNSTTGAVIGTF